MRNAFLSCILTLITAVFISQSYSSAGESTSPNTPRQAGKDHPLQLEDLPESELKKQLRKLPDHARNAALTHLAKKNLPAEALATLRADKDGGLYHICAITGDGQAFLRARGGAVRKELADCLGIPFLRARAGAVQTRSVGTRASVPVSSPSPAPHSRPGSVNLVLLSEFQRRDNQEHRLESGLWRPGV